MKTEEEIYLNRFRKIILLREKKISDDQSISLLRQINDDYVMKGGRLSSPLVVMIDLTSNCNQNCIFCYRSGPPMLMPDGKPKFLKPGNFEKICKELKELNVFSITLTGGEPTLNPNFIEAVHLLKQFGFSVTIVTNGTGITEKNINRLAQLLDPTCDKVELSFNAASAQVFQAINRTDGFHNFLRTLHCFHEYHIPFLTMTLILGANYSQIDDILDMASQHGARECAVEPPFPKRNMPKDACVTIDKLLDIHENLCQRDTSKPKIQLNILHLAMNLKGGLQALKSSFGYDGRSLSSCHGGSSSCAIDIDGNVHMCQFLIDLKNCAVGNIYQESFLTLWQKLQQMKSSLVRGDNQSPGLDGCLGFALEQGYHH